MEVSFYQTAEGNLVSSAVRLLEKIYASGLRCIFFSPLEERVKTVDKALWTFSTNAFIPHGDKDTGFCDLQPIYFTARVENPNGAKAVMLLDTFDYAAWRGVERFIPVFEDEQRAEIAKALCNDLKKSGENVNYWKQSPKGWEKAV
ncbi:MAG: DNA polymerase III subunit chi [Holosporaceae bacterium]|jgi:DNA polymerase-3 subunit chi|nr:DNA polymerase III subunit chi [Holosporaceae bacterium]